jgi:hypothetical protein
LAAMWIYRLLLAREQPCLPGFRGTRADKTSI